ncbi:CDKAL1 [Lepeophtheirus salmonis]|uniref:tRNA-t(6)A37 methylthiotransferase n=1 Tax=Lepeophtheirus salmonis TaxID=72036 RepID=A0A7R8CEL9_LEPSM|nr:CDKAL1 [Lepeophtheirus salmonis]CAF2758402.1 CDKAL1 [Lepeophtheirus salmonis]
MIRVGDEEVEDIEDILSGGPIVRRTLNIGPRLSKSLQATNDDDELQQEKELNSFVPGTTNVYIKTWGWVTYSHLYSILLRFSIEYMAGLLSAQGYNISFEDKESAEVWILNSCTVKNPAEDHFRNEVDGGLKDGKKVIVAGCVPQGKPGSEYLKGLSVIGVQQIDRVVEVLEETLKGNSVRLLGSKKSQRKKKAGGASLALPKIRKNPLIEIIAINTGCLNQCTYCKTKHARGELGSYPPEEIVARAQSCFEEEGVVEIWLTSEDTGAYGRDIGTTLPELLWKLTEVIPKGCRLRLGMTNPPYIMDHLDEMAKVLSHPRVYKFLHVPVQSGADAVLKDMKREYTVDDFSKVVNVLKNKVPGITIATDIIAGFPTETDDDFKETMILCKKYKFPSLFINQFFPRPGTPAAKMKRVATTKEVKKRTKELSDYFQSYEPYKKSNWEKMGHNEFYEQILVPKDDVLLGKCVDIEITSVSKFSMMGKLVSEPVLANDAPLKSAEVEAPKSYKGSLIYKLSLGILFLAVCVRILQLFSCALSKNKMKALLFNF